MMTLVMVTLVMTYSDDVGYNGYVGNEDVTSSNYVVWVTMVTIDGWRDGISLSHQHGRAISGQ